MRVHSTVLLERDIPRLLGPQGLLTEWVLLESFNPCHKLHLKEDREGKGKHRSVEEVPTGKIHGKGTLECLMQGRAQLAHWEIQS